MKKNDIMNGMENEPKCVAKLARSVKCEPGTYYFCMCGYSKDGVFCDGAHKKTSFLPKKMKLFEPTVISVCLCKQTKMAPYCDGSHQYIKRGYFFDKE